MPQSVVKLYVHLVWTTYCREPLLSGKREQVVHRILTSEANKLHCTVLAVGGIEDHVHVLLALPPQFDLPRLLHQMKGVSSHVVRQDSDGEGFGWQDGYAALSVSPNHVARVKAYIKGQREHHGCGEVHPAWEAAISAQRVD